MRTLPALALPLIVLTACGGGGGGGGGGSTTINAGTGGGQLMGTGSLAGVVLTIPANSLGGDTMITASVSTSTPSTGFAATGIAVQFDPAGIVFNPPATLTLPYNPTRVPGGANAANMIVERLSSTGALTQLTPTSVDTTANTVTVSIGGFSRFWAAIEEPSTTGETITFEDYFPLLDGSTYNFDDGSVLEALIDPQNGMLPRPPFPNIAFNVIASTDPSGTERNYTCLSKFANGDIVQHGLVGEDQSGAEAEVNNPALFMTRTVVTGTTVTSSFEYLGYELPNVTTPTYGGDIEYSGRVDRAAPMTVPAGAFEDVIELEITEVRTVNDPPFSETDVTTLFLARGVGPIKIQSTKGAQELTSFQLGN